MPWVVKNAILDIAQQGGIHVSLGDNIRSCHSCGTKKYQLPILDEAPEGDKVIM